MQDEWKKRSLRVLQGVSESGTVQVIVGPEGGQGGEWAAGPHDVERLTKTRQKLSFHIPNHRPRPSQEQLQTPFPAASPGTAFCSGHTELSCLLCASLSFCLLLLFLSYNECFKDHMDAMTFSLD